MFKAAFKREIQLSIAKPVAVFYPLAIAILICLVVAFAIGPNPSLLQNMAPATLFIALLLALFLALDRLFEGDVADGSFDLMIMAERELLPWLYGKACGFACCQMLAMLLAFPLLLLLLDLPGSLVSTALLSLLLSAIALSFLGLSGAALMARLESENRANGGALLQLLLIIPQTIPVLIFAVGAIGAKANGDSPAQALYFLTALTLAYLCFAPMAARLAIRSS